jgi:hypothetical protein
MWNVGENVIHFARCYAGEDIALRCPYHQIGTPPVILLSQLFGKILGFHLPAAAQMWWHSQPKRPGTCHLRLMIDDIRLAREA